MHNYLSQVSMSESNVFLIAVFKMCASKPKTYVYFLIPSGSLA